MEWNQLYLTLDVVLTPVIPSTHGKYLMSLFLYCCVIGARKRVHVQLAHYSSVETSRCITQSTY